MADEKVLNMDEIMEILAENERLKTELASRPPKRERKDPKIAAAARRERLANDPEYKEKYDAKRREAQARRKAKLSNDPEYAAHAKAVQRANAEKRKAELAAFREWQKTQGASNSTPTE